MFLGRQLTFNANTDAPAALSNCINFSGKYQGKEKQPFPAAQNKRGHVDNTQRCAIQSTGSFIPHYIVVVGRLNDAVMAE